MLGFAIYLTGSTLALALFGQDAPATIHVSDVKRSRDQDTPKITYQVSEQYTFWVDGEPHQGSIIYSTESPGKGVTKGATRQGTVRYWPGTPGFNEPGSRANFQELGPFGSIRVFLLPFAVAAMLGFVVYRSLFKKRIAAKVPPKKSGPGWLEKLLEPFGIRREEPAGPDSQCGWRWPGERVQTTGQICLMRTVG